MDYKNIYIRLPAVCLCVFWILVLILFICAYQEYKGEGYIYIFFTIISNLLLYLAFRKESIFFDTFIGVFLWLGFWLKFTIRVVFMDGQFYESIGNFDGTGLAYDRAVMVATCGLSGLLAASIIREKIMFNYPEAINEIGREREGLLKFYQNHRKILLTGFVISFVIVSVTNAYYGIYQRGSIPRMILPYGLSGIYKWLLLFGLASFSALILQYELTINKKITYLGIILSLLESFFSNVSLLSRGMILNTSALMYGLLKGVKLFNQKIDLRLTANSFLIFILMFGGSVYLVDYIRWVDNTKYLHKDLDYSARKSKSLLIDRWVGMEGVMAVSSYPATGWNLWDEAWDESFGYNKLTFYDNKLITSQYRNKDLTKYHHISLPGIVAFCFYPGSFVFLFFSLFVIGIFAAVIELSAFKLSESNVILCSLMAMVVASRFAHFGYVPKQSYLLFGSLYLNLFIIYFLNRFFTNWYKRKTAY